MTQKDLCMSPDLLTKTPRSRLFYSVSLKYFSANPSQWSASQHGVTPGQIRLDTAPAH